MLALALAVALATPAADPKPDVAKIDVAKADPFVFKDGDRVVFLGSTLIEREQKYGYWELALTLKNAGKAVTFRNLGWSGDTVLCESRGSFGGPASGYQRTITLVKELKPTVIVICYGHNESFEGEPGVKKFSEGLTRLIDAITPTSARIVLMSPTPFSDVKPLEDARGKNANLRLYIDAAKAIADAKKHDFADLHAHLSTGASETNDLEPLSDNGLHLTANGYRYSSLFFLGGKYTADPALKQLREKIIEKNQLFFHRWRPQNETYLFGFRKGEQGRNGKEIPEFDPLIAVVEKEIAELSKSIK